MRGKDVGFLPGSWSGIFAPESALLEHFARGTELYFGTLVLMRCMPRRSGGAMAAMDLVFVVLIPNAATNAMGEYTSAADGLLLAMVFKGWNSLINFLSYRLPFFWNGWFPRHPCRSCETVGSCGATCDANSSPRRS